MQNDFWRGVIAVYAAQKFPSIGFAGKCVKIELELVLAGDANAPRVPIIHAHAIR